MDQGVTTTKNEIEISKNESRIMRKLLRKGKCIGIHNVRNILEVDSY